MHGDLGAIPGELKGDRVAETGRPYKPFAKPRTGTELSKSSSSKNLFARLFGGAEILAPSSPKSGMRLASAVTLINVLVATGFSIIGLVRPDLIVPLGTKASGASAIFAMYAAARAIPLAVAVLLAVLSRSPVAVLILGTLAGTVQGLDAIIGIIHHDPGKTIGPLILAVAQGYAMLVLRKRMRSAP
jgi:hypothetical protein